jgi:hypothetical protein
VHPLRKLAGALMIASTVTHLSEPFFFTFGFPLLVAQSYGVSFLFIGVFLLRGSERVLWWGAVLPLSAAFLGTANSIIHGYMRPITRWHLLVDLIVGPACIYLMRQRRSPKDAAA